MKSKKFKSNIINTLNKTKYFVGNLFHLNYIPVIAYHWFSISRKDTDNRWVASIDEFEKQIIWLKKRKYHFVNCNEFINWFERKLVLPKKSVLLTFDDGEVSQLKLAAPILKKYGAIGICFVVGKFFNSEARFGSVSKGEDSIEHFSKDEYDESPCKDALELGSHTYDLHYRFENVTASNICDNQTIYNDFLKMKFFGFDAFASPYGDNGPYFDSIILDFHRIGFSINNSVRLYANRKNNPQRINRIMVDGDCDLREFKKIF